MPVTRLFKLLVGRPKRRGSDFDAIEENPDGTNNALHSTTDTRCTCRSKMSELIRMVYVMTERDDKLPFAIQETSMKRI